MADRGWEKRTIEDIEGDVWGDAPADATYLVRTCTELRRKPLGRYEPEDLRIMIGQRIGLEVLVPMALGMLVHEPLLEGDFYPGDLLSAVMRVPDDFWAAHPAEETRLREAVAALDSVGRDHPDYPDFSDEFEEGLARTRIRLARS